jgi:hypothetical protein
MKSSNGIVAGGGWTKQRAVGRPKAQWFGLFSLLWLGVSICALSPFSEGWPYVFGYLEWLCLSLLVPQPILIALTIFFLLTDSGNNRSRIPSDVRIFLSVIAGLIIMMATLWLAMRLMGWD